MRIASVLIIAWLGAWLAAAASIAADVPTKEGELRATLERLLPGMAAKDLPAREWPQYIGRRHVSSWAPPATRPAERRPAK